MTKRTYDQVCALSTALDLIGDRWTLLIVREMLFGARRYSDILRGTPGLGTNLLAKRLKELEQAGFIEQRRLPPPAASTVYALTEQGRTVLRPIIRAMTEMGVQYLHYPPHEGHFVPVSSTMGAMSKFFRCGGGYSGSAEFRTPDDVFHCVIKDGQMMGLGFGQLDSADLILKSTADTYMGLVVGYIDVQTALESGEVEILRGESADVSKFFANFEYTLTENVLN